MKRTISAILFLLSLTTETHAQLLCIPRQEFNYPMIAQRAGLSPSFFVRFDVVGFTPKNINIVAMDSSSKNSLELFKYSVIENIQRLIYLKDSNDVHLRIKYQIRQAALLNTSYAELVAVDELHIVATYPLIQKSIGYGSKNNPAVDSIFIDALVPYKSGIAHQSDIVVKRIFLDSKDSTIIVRNNYTDLAKEIDSLAQKYSKEYFLAFAPNARYYFIRFRVVRILPDCNCEQIF